MGSHKEKQDRQVSFKIDQPLHDRIEAAAAVEVLSPTDFVRKVFIWGLEQYEAVGSIRTLWLMSLPEELIERTLEEERARLRQRRVQLKQKKNR